MTHRRAPGVVPILVGLFVGAVGGPVSAQERQTCGADFQLGTSLPVGELAETADVGATVGLSLGCRIADRLSLGAGVHLEGHPGGSGTQRWLLEPALALTEPGVGRWVVTARLEGGYAWNWGQSGGPSLPVYLDRGDLVPFQGVVGGFGMRLSRRFSEHFGCFADAGIRVLFADSDDVVLADRRIEGMSWPVSVPMTIGLNVGF